MDDELKPCPFCGGKNPLIIEDVQYPDSPYARTWYAVECNVCDATGNWDLGKSGATEQWNTRPTEDALRGELDDYKADYRRIAAEECAPDEQHCTCVPPMRKEIERLTGALKDAIECLEVWGSYVPAHFLHKHNFAEDTERLYEDEA